MIFKLAVDLRGPGRAPGLRPFFLFGAETSQLPTPPRRDLCLGHAGMLGSLTSTAAEKARRAARFGADHKAAQAQAQGKAKPRIPHPDAPAQLLAGDPQQALITVVKARLAAGEDISPYQLSLLQTFGLSLADFSGAKKRAAKAGPGGSAKGSGKRRRAEAEARSEGAAAALAPAAGGTEAEGGAAQAPPPAPEHAQKRSYAAVAAAPPAASPSGSVPSLRRQARSLERLQARQAEGGVLSRPERDSLALLPAVYQALMARMGEQ